VETVHALLEGGVAVDATDMYGDTALDKVTHGGSPDVAQRLRDGGAALCRDRGGPWLCLGRGCPALPITCARVSRACHLRFGEIWPAVSLWDARLFVDAADSLVGQHCQRSCAWCRDQCAQHTAEELADPLEEPSLVALGELRPDLELFGHAGMRRADLEAQGRMLRISVTPMMDDALREEVLRAVRNDSLEWTTERHPLYPSTDVRVLDLPRLEAPITHLLEQRIFPGIANTFEVDEAHLVLHDLFLVKYDTAGQDALVRHADGSCFSFIAQLNSLDDFEGGGTRFYLRPGLVYSKAVTGWLSVPPGQALLFSGRRHHVGRRITRGTRFILTGFVD